MPSTLNVDVAVNQSQLQSAVASIQKTISSASYGSGGFGGFSGGGPGGFSFPASFSGGAMPGRSQFVIPPHPHQYAVQSSSMPVGIMRQQLNSVMQGAMGQAASGQLNAGLQYMMPQYDRVSTGKLAMGSAVKAGASSLLFNAGQVLGTLVTGSPMIGGTVGGFAMNWLAGSKVGGMVEDMFYGGQKSRAYSSKAMATVTGNMKRSMVGGFMASTMGFNPADFVTGKARSGFVQQLGAMNMGMAKSLRMEAGELASYAQGAQFSTEGLRLLQGYSRTLNAMKSASTGTFDQSAFEATSAYKDFKSYVVQTRTIASRMNVSPNDLALLGAGAESLFRYKRPKTSTWTKMGRSLGRTMGMGRGWGVDLMRAVKPLVSTDLNMSDAQLKVMGKATKRGAAYAQFALSGFAPGGENWYRTMLMGAGQAPRGLLDIGGQMGAAFSNPQAAMQAWVNADLTMGKMGGKGIVTLQRKSAMDQVMMLRQTGVIDNNMKNADAYQFILQQQGMHPIKARAMSRSTFGVGDKIYYSGGGKFRELTSKSFLTTVINKARGDLGMTKDSPLMVSKKLAYDMRNINKTLSGALKTYTSKGMKLSAARAALAKDMADGKAIKGVTGLTRKMIMMNLTGAKSTEMAEALASGLKKSEALYKGSMTGKTDVSLKKDIAAMGGYQKTIRYFKAGLNKNMGVLSTLRGEELKAYERIMGDTNKRAAMKEVIKKAERVGGAQNLDQGAGLTGDQWSILLGKTKGLFDALEKIVAEMNQRPKG